MVNTVVHLDNELKFSTHHKFKITAIYVAQKHLQLIMNFKQDDVNKLAAVNMIQLHVHKSTKEVQCHRHCMAHAVAIIIKILHSGI